MVGGRAVKSVVAEEIKINGVIKIGGSVPSDDHQSTSHKESNPLGHTHGKGPGVQVTGAAYMSLVGARVEAATLELV